MITFKDLSKEKQEFLEIYFDREDLDKPKDHILVSVVIMNFTDWSLVGRKFKKRISLTYYKFRSLERFINRATYD